MSNTATQELRALVDQIREALWPAEDPTRDWSPDTLDEIAEAFAQHRPDMIPDLGYDLEMPA